MPFMWASIMGISCFSFPTWLHLWSSVVVVAYVFAKRRCEMRWFHNSLIRLGYRKEFHLINLIWPQIAATQHCETFDERDDFIFGPHHSSPCLRLGKWWINSTRDNNSEFLFSYFQVICIWSPPRERRPVVPESEKQCMSKLSVSK